jgi:hypothetical protein
MAHAFVWLICQLPASADGGWPVICSDLTHWLAGTLQKLLLHGVPWLLTTYWYELVAGYSVAFLHSLISVKNNSPHNKVHAVLS